MKLKVGDTAPDFTLKNQEGKNISVSNFRGSNLLIYFYPADFTPHCTSQACNLRNNFNKLTEKDIKVIGISTNTSDKHKEFRDEYNLQFDLLADETGEVASLYDSISEVKFLGFTFGKFAKRNSFLVDKEGKIVKIMENVEPQTHSYEILHFFQ